MAAQQQPNPAPIVGYGPRGGAYRGKPENYNPNFVRQVQQQIASTPAVPQPSVVMVPQQPMQQQQYYPRQQQYQSGYASGGGGYNSGYGSGYESDGGNNYRGRARGRGRGGRGRGRGGRGNGRGNGNFSGNTSGEESDNDAGFGGRSRSKSRGQPQSRDNSAPKRSVSREKKPKPSPYSEDDIRRNMKPEEVQKVYGFYLKQQRKALNNKALVIPLLEIGSDVFRKAQVEMANYKVGLQVGDREAKERAIAKQDRKQYPVFTASMYTIGAEHSDELWQKCATALSNHGMPAVHHLHTYPEYMAFLSGSYSTYFNDTTMDCYSDYKEALMNLTKLNPFTVVRTIDFHIAERTVLPSPPKVKTGLKPSAFIGASTVVDDDPATVTSSGVPSAPDAPIRTFKSVARITLEVELDRVLKDVPHYFNHALKHKKPRYLAEGVIHYRYNDLGVNSFYTTQNLKGETLRRAIAEVKPSTVEETKGLLADAIKKVSSTSSMFSGVSSGAEYLFPDSVRHKAAHISISKMRDIATDQTIVEVLAKLADPAVFDLIKSRSVEQLKVL